MKALHLWLAIWFGMGVVCPLVRGATEPGIFWERRGFPRGRDVHGSNIHEPHLAGGGGGFGVVFAGDVVGEGGGHAVLGGPGAETFDVPGLGVGQRDGLGGGSKEVPGYRGVWQIVTSPESKSQSPSEKKRTKLQLTNRRI